MAPRFLTFLTLIFGQAPLTAQETSRPDFAKDIQPILKENCMRCHGPKKSEGGLRLDVRRRVHLGGDSGPALGPKGELWLRLTSNDPDRRMPPSGAPLSKQQLDTVKAWLDQGAHWPDALAGRESWEEHWAFRPIQRPTVPEVKTKALVRNPIDAFVLARLEAKGLPLSPPADPATLLRRLHLDLIGLPPSPKDIADFAARWAETRRQSSQDPVEAVVNHLLASPHFGERWGRHWLDLARFAESDGYENDNIRPTAWRYRDWVIAAVNRDLPFDQFTVQQLAGDLLPESTTEHKVATGFHRNTLWNSAASADKEEFRTLAIKDRADTTAAAWMGLTFGCAKCHGHKYDPVTQREYYRLYAFFNNTNHQDVKVADGQAMALASAVRPTHVHLRGNFQMPGEKVTPGVPAFLPAIKTRGKDADRLDLARWLVDPNHPLTARVAVNRFWQHLFGQGLVRSPENFGVGGEEPTHPELLDWLATEFVRLKWSNKELLRTIVLSSSYRQASTFPKDSSKVDPDNRLLSRQNRFRVEAEIIRDQALAVSGLLDRTVGGPSIVPPFPDGFLAQKFEAEALRRPTKDHRRRSVYIHVQRTLQHPVLAAFDAADGNQPCLRRDRSTTPMQALTLLNDPVFHECVLALGQKLTKVGKDRDERLRQGFLLCLGRPPTAGELEALSDLVRTQERLGAGEAQVWLGVARTLLNLEEFITRE
jgi:cytochrome c553